MEAAFEGPVTDQWSNIIYSELTQESILIISHSRLYVHRKNREKSIFEISLSQSEGIKTDHCDTNLFAVLTVVKPMLRQKLLHIKKN